jgi:hypothetical protein
VRKPPGGAASSPQTPSRPQSQMASFAAFLSTPGGKVAVASLGIAAVVFVAVTTLKTVKKTLCWLVNLITLSGEMERKLDEVHGWYSRVRDAQTKFHQLPPNQQTQQLQQEIDGVGSDRLTYAQCHSRLNSKADMVHSDLAV